MGTCALEDPDKQPELKGALELALGRSRSQDEFLHLGAMGKEGEELDGKEGDGAGNGNAKGNSFDMIGIMQFGPS